jgi:DNA-binding transcriptional LysR family regulator
MIIDAVNLASIDLNLLVAFEALMAERHVTRAAQRVGLAQSSMSNLLNRLRSMLHDEVLVRTSTGMQPTARALALAPAVAEALGLLRGALGPQPDFDPRTSHHRFTIAVTDYSDLVVVPPLTAALRQEAPFVDLTIRPITSLDEAVSALERGTVDLAIGGHLPDVPACRRFRLFKEHFVCVRSAASPGPLDLDHYLARPHVLFSPLGGDGLGGAVDVVLAAQGLGRRVAVTVPHVVALPFVVAATDLVGTVAKRIACRFADAASIVIEPCPIPLASFDIDLVMRRDRYENPVTGWLAELMRRVGDQEAKPMRPRRSRPASGMV